MPEGLDVGLLALLVTIAVLVAISNVWLRRRAERENRRVADDKDSSPERSPRDPRD